MSTQTSAEFNPKRYKKSKRKISQKTIQNNLKLRFSSSQIHLQNKSSRVNIEKMTELTLTKNEVYQIIKKRKIESNQTNDESIEEEDINELIINSETDRFLELFKKVFSEEEEEQLDSEDSFVQDIFSGVVIRIKEKLTQLGSTDKSQLINFVFKFLKNIFTKSNGEGKSSSA